MHGTNSIEKSASSVFERFAEGVVWLGMMSITIWALIVSAVTAFPGTTNPPSLAASGPPELAQIGSGFSPKL
jgi:hypothetical protein